MRSAMANNQNRPAMTSASPTAAEPISLTRPIWGSWSVVSRSASFSVAVLSNPTTSTRTTTAISSTRRIVVAPISQASGNASASAVSSSRTACSERMAKTRPLRVLIVARQNRSNSKSRGDRHRLGLAAASLEQCRDQESHVDRLLGVEAGIADRVIAIAEVLVGDGARAADAFGDVLPGHLQMHAAGIAALRRVDGEERLHLRQDPVEWTGLVAAVRRDGVAMHGIARPHHHPALALHGANELRQMIADLVRTEAIDQRQASGIIVRIEHVDQPQQFVRLERGTAFQSDRILDAAEIFDMAVIELAGAVADPDHMARGRVVTAAGGIDPGEGLLIAEQQRLVAGIEIRGAETGIDREVQAAGAHEIERLRNPVGQVHVALRLRRILYRFEHPLMNIVHRGTNA